MLDIGREGLTERFANNDKLRKQVYEFEHSALYIMFNISDVICCANHNDQHHR